MTVRRTWLSSSRWAALGAAAACGVSQATAPEPGFQAQSAIAKRGTARVPASVAPATVAPAVANTVGKSPPPIAPTAVPPVAVPPFGVAPLPPPPFVHAPVLGDPCGAPGSPEPTTLREPFGAKKYFSIDGYIARSLRMTRGAGAAQRTHCISVAWPPGDRNSAGKPTRVAKHIDGAWFRAIENTLARLPWRHVEAVRRFVIDDRPTLHGVAPFDRQSADDARDGHTIWLHQHLFRDFNHWVRGNHGTYWGYHVNVDGVAFDGRAADHGFFSPVLLHEIGHTVMYNLVNAAEEAARTPECAETCGDAPQGCAPLPPAAREQGCISPYCMPFDFPGSTENWAELYRFHYQSSTTRGLLGRARAACANVLAALDFDADDPALAPWDRGLPDIAGYRPSRWKSCGNRACKPW